VPENYVISGQTLTGKTLVALALSEYAKQQGLKVGYFKPVGVPNDADAALMKEVLSLSADLENICPIERTKSSYDELLKAGYEQLRSKILNSYNVVSDGKDIVLIEGTEAPWHLLHVNLSTPQIAEELDARAICLVNFQDVTAIDDVLLQKDLFLRHNVKDLTIALNMVPPMFKTIVSTSIADFIESSDMKFLGSIYRNRELFAPSVQEILKALDGQMVVGEEKEDVLVDRFMVGSMAPENALKWFRRAKNKAVITSGDRADICMAAMETDTNLLILTGGMGPNIRTLAQAREKGIPIMMTGYDTYTTGQIVDSLIGTVTTENIQKVPVVVKILRESLNFDVLNIKPKE
jgi:hypothetical protein